MFKIETWENNPILRKIADKVTDNNFRETVKLGKQMIKYIKNPDNGWVWLAAPQIGKSISLFVVSLPKDWDDENFKTIMMINPEILEFSQETNIEEEWCLSLPDAKGKVKRSTKIKVTYLDDKKSQNTLILEWLQARIVQHEFDHVIGKLFIDYIN
jgi:peptide deformylase